MTPEPKPGPRSSVPDSHFCPPQPGAAPRTASRIGINPNLRRAERRSPAPCLLLPAQNKVVWTGTPNRWYRKRSWTHVRWHYPADERRYRTDRQMEPPEKTGRPYKVILHRRLPCWISVKPHNAPRWKSERVLLPWVWSDRISPAFSDQQETVYMDGRITEPSLNRLFYFVLRSQSELRDI